MIRRWLPRSVGGQLLALLLLALAITQGLSLILLTGERNLAVRAALGLEAAGRAANVALLLEAAPTALQGSILASADSPLVRFALEATPQTPHSSFEAVAMVARMRQILGDARDIRAEVHGLAGPPPELPEGLPDAMRPMHRAMMAARPEPVELTLSIRLEGGNWLNVRTMFQRPGVQWSPRALLPLVLMLAAVALVAGVTARRIVGPMRALAAGAERLGRGLDAAPLALTGPTEVQEATQAFNRMQARLTRLIAERTRMLAALSHDLRSPLTAMRLRVELLAEDEDSTRLKALVEEMQAMVEQTLDFARAAAQGAAAQGEAVQEVDLAALLRDLVADAGAGHATLTAPESVFLTLRPTAIRRALRNLIDNALRYGTRAEVALVRQGGEAVITIADHGPGLPEDQLEAVFEPFVRGEASRSRATGGVGLGLAIARSIARAQGGEVTLANRPEGGLLATLRLPLRPA
ncbi:MAG: HAMP domain-containing protein [Rhodobacterales bacterium]|nr:HAMP domain-containing protein [Rhodobacterales bacterium]